MPTVFLEIAFEAGSLGAAGFDGIDEIEDPLDEALADAALGEVTGGGGGDYGSTIDVELEDASRFEEGLALIRKVLRQVGATETTRINRYRPVHTVYSVYE